jgi:hypothetical protein
VIPSQFHDTERVQCFSLRELNESWKTDGSEDNCKKMAFIWYFCAQEIYKTADLGSLKEWIEKKMSAGNEY